MKNIVQLLLFVFLFIFVNKFLIAQEYEVRYSTWKPIENGYIQVQELPFCTYIERYNVKNQLIEKEYYLNDSIASTIKIQYNNDKKEIETTYGKNGQVVKTNTFKYDSISQLMSEYENNIKYGTYSTIDYEYKNGQLEKKIDHGNTNKPTDTYLYSYPAKNQIEVHFFRNNQLKSITYSKYNDQKIKLEERYTHFKKDSLTTNSFTSFNKWGLENKKENYDSNDSVQSVKTFEYIMLNDSSPDWKIKRTITDGILKMEERKEYINLP